MARIYEISGECMGSWDQKKETIIKEIKFLGRTIRMESDGYSWESDPKHLRILLDEHGMTDCKALDLPTVKGDYENKTSDRECHQTSASSRPPELHGLGQA